MRIILWPDLRYHRVYSSSLPRSFTDESTSSCRMEPTSFSSSFSLFPIVTSLYSFTISGRGCIQLQIKVVLIFWKMIYGLAYPCKEGTRINVGIPVLYNLQVRSSCFSATCCKFFIVRGWTLRDDSNSKLKHHTYGVLILLATTITFKLAIFVADSLVNLVSLGSASWQIFKRREDIASSRWTKAEAFCPGASASGPT